MVAVFLPADKRGMVVTYAQVARQPDLLRALCVARAVSAR